MTWPVGAVAPAGRADGRNRGGRDPVGAAGASRFGKPPAFGSSGFASAAADGSRALPATKPATGNDPGTRPRSASRRGGFQSDAWVALEPAASGKRPMAGRRSRPAAGGDLAGLAARRAGPADRPYLGVGGGHRGSATGAAAREPAVRSPGGVERGVRGVIPFKGVAGSARPPSVPHPPHREVGVSAQRLCPPGERIDAPSIAGVGGVGRGGPEPPGGRVRPQRATKPTQTSAGAAHRIGAEIVRIVDAHGVREHRSRGAA